MYHKFLMEDGTETGSFETFHSSDVSSDLDLEEGWYWWPCEPGCLPDTTEPPNGPHRCERCAKDHARDETTHEHLPMFYCVSVYLLDQAYGGPEEGGWWYTTGTPALEHGSHTRIFQKLQDAEMYANELRTTLLPNLNKGRRPMSSVLSDGEYAVNIDEDQYPVSFPTRRPHYE